MSDAPGMVAAGPITPTSPRPVLFLPDGRVATEYSTSFRDDAGHEVLIPTLARDGSRILSFEEAVDQYYRTGEFIGKFETTLDADTFAGQFHNRPAPDNVRQAMVQHYFGPQPQPAVVPPVPAFFDAPLARGGGLANALRGR